MSSPTEEIPPDRGGGLNPQDPRFKREALSGGDDKEFPQRIDTLRKPLISCDIVLVTISIHIFIQMTPHYNIKMEVY